VAGVFTQKAPAMLYRGLAFGLSEAIMVKQSPESAVKNEKDG